MLGLSIGSLLSFRLEKRSQVVLFSVPNLLKLTKLNSDHQKMLQTIFKALGCIYNNLQFTLQRKLQIRGSKHLLTEAMDWFLVKNNLKIYSVFMGTLFLSTKFWVLGKLDWHRLRAKIKSRSAKSCSGRIKTSFFLGEKILFWSRCLVQMRCLRGHIFFQAPELTSSVLSDMVPLLLFPVRF